MKLHFRKYGTGTPLIILHGLFGSGLNWNSVGKKLAENYTVYILDQRNHGKSPHSDFFSYQHLCDDLLAFYQHYGINKAVLMGHSMGGKVVLDFSFAYPKMVEKLIIVDIGIKEYPVKDESLLNAMTNLDLKKHVSRKEIDIELRKTIKDESLRLFIMQNLQRGKDNQFSWRMNLPVLAEKIDEVSKKIHTKTKIDNPALFVVGQQSDYVLPGDMDDLKKQFTNIQFAIIKNAGHWVHADEPGLFEKAVTKFLEIG